MRISYVLFFSLISIQSLHAENTLDPSSALAELDGEGFAFEPQISEWDQLLQQAEQQKFKKAGSDFVYDCAFPDAPEYQAPGWVCDEPVEGFEFTAVGSGSGGIYKDKVEKLSNQQGEYINRVDPPIKAYLDALVFGQSVLNVVVASKVNEHTNEDDVKIKEDEIVKQMTSLSSLSEKTQLRQMVTIYSEFNEKGEKTASISSAVLKLTHGSEQCRTIIKTYVETDLEDNVDVVETTASRGQCGFNQIVEDMAESGWNLVNMVKSPGGEHYVLVGYNGTIVDEASSSMENDRSLWEQFKAQQGDELEEELKKEFGSE